MPSSEAPSLSTQKSLFLHAQTRLLSAPLQISSQYRSTLYSSSAGQTHPQISDKAITILTQKVNDEIKRHNKVVFSAQSIQYVVEQIETLYWNEVRGELRGEWEYGDWEGVGGEGEWRVGVERDVDLGVKQGVEALPESMEDALLDARGQDQDERSGVSEEESRRYAELRRRLVKLVKQRDEKKERLDRYRKLQELLRPYEDVQKIQPNLVTKDGEMSRELDRMRVLLARVGARMGSGDFDRKDLDEKERMQEKGFEQKLQEVIELG
jgi:hypothetical protein